MTAGGMRIGLDHAGFTYQGGTPAAFDALRDITLTVEPGERVAITGPVGSGKSTLLSLLAGVELPVSGQVSHDGREISEKKPATPGVVGLAFQSPERCLFGKTVFDDVGFAPRHQGLAEPDVALRVEEALSTAGLDPLCFAKRSPFSLSTGEQRRAALAGLLAMRPRALLLDEPTVSLDPPGRRDIMNKLVRLNQETGVTMVVTGHDMDELALFAERVIIIDGGRLAVDGQAAAILTDSDLLAAHQLAPPGTVELCRLLGDATGEPVTPTLDEGQVVGLLLDFIERGGD